MVFLVERKRKRSKIEEEPAPPTPPTSDADAEADTAKWAILETGVLAVETSLKVIGIDGTTRPVFFDHHQQRLVCKHGWAAGKVCAFVADSSLKPKWSSCDCTSACGLSCAKTAPHVAAAAAHRPPPYYEVLQRTPSVPLASGLKGYRLPGVFDKLERPVFRVVGDPLTILRCQHGNSTTQLRGDRAQDRRDAAHLIALVWKRRSARAAATATATAATVYALVVMRALYATAAGRQRVRQGKIGRLRCTCTPVFPPRHVQQLHCGRPPKRSGPISWAQDESPR